MKQSNDGKPEAQKTGADCCSETDTEGEDCSIACNSPLNSISNACEMESNYVEEINDDIPLISFLDGCKRSSKLESTILPVMSNAPGKSKVVSPTSPARSSGTVVGRKRVRLVLSDDEDDDGQTDLGGSKGSIEKCPVEGIGTSGGNGCMPGQLYVCIPIFH